MNTPPKRRLLLVGAASGMSRLVAARLAADFELFGVDIRPLAPGASFPGSFLQVGYTKRRIAEVFRQGRFEILVHVGRISSLADASRKVRFEQNVYGTANLLRLGLAHGVSKFVILGTHLVYGAHRDCPLYLREDDPLRASESFSALFDAIELDLETRAFIWQHRQVQTVLLRPVHIIGPTTRHALATLLSSGFCPKLLGFDPLMQFLDESDATRAVELAVRRDVFGIFNVAGEGVVPYSRAIELAGAAPVVIPTTLARAGARLRSMLGTRLPPHMIDYIKYPTIVSDQAFRRAVDWEPAVTTVEGLRRLAEVRRQV